MSDSDSNTITKSLKTEVQTRELIDLVRQNSCLWDRAVPEYRNRAAKDKAWQAIFTHFQPNYDELSPRERNQIGSFITKKWCNIRDSYVKSRKPIRTHKRPYIYSEEMKFLDSSIFCDSSSSRKRAHEDDDDRTSNEEVEHEAEEPVSWIDEVFVDTDLNIDQHDLSAKRVKLEPKEYPKYDTDNIVGFLANLIQKEDDEDRAFFKSITPTVKKLSENSKLEFRILVIKLLKNLKSRDRQKATMKKEKMPNMDSESE